MRRKIFRLFRNHLKTRIEPSMPVSTVTLRRVILSTRIAFWGCDGSILNSFYPDSKSQLSGYG
ncbi:hypothetical protein [Methylobacter sp. sgz302048]|uniref:hypothetical protein n=1 Tax=Methylobacter sp. sgz302048 TaxID=3455945 RepID=UPI003F9F8363